jgi:LCP family protein required for cell wall assembly
MAAILALPIVALLALAIVVGLTGDRMALAVRLLDPKVLGTLLALQGLVLGWRLLAVGSAFRMARRRPPVATSGAFVLALAIVILPQAYVGNLTAVARETAAEIFEPVVDEEPSPSSPTTYPPVVTDDPDFMVPIARPATPPPPGMEARVNVLLIGMDSGAGRTTALTDTMIVASLDPIGKTVSMVSIPRDMVDVPLADGRTFRGKINSLVSYVRWHPGKFPGAPDGQTVLAGALGELLGLRIDHWAQVDMGGFIQVVDSVKGIDIQVRKGFCDPRYDDYGMNGFGIKPGRYHMTGSQALAYARIRKAAGESDFTRAGRQQEVIAALRDRIVRGGFLADPIAFLRSVGKTVRTNLPPQILAEYVAVTSEIDRSRVFRDVIDRPLVRGTLDQRGSIQVPDLKGIRELAARLFTIPGTDPVGIATLPEDPGGTTTPASSTGSCVVPATPKPSLTPEPATAEPSAPPEASPTATATPAPATPSPSSAPSPEPTPTPTATSKPGPPTPEPSVTPSPTAAP